MFCGQCGSHIQTGASACLSCGAAIAHVSAGASTSLPQAGSRLQQGALPAAEKLKTRSQDAFSALKATLMNPAGSLSPSFQLLEKRQAMEVGGVMAAAYSLLTVTGVYLALPRWAGSPGLDVVFKIIIFSLMPVAATVAASALVRKVFGGTSGSIEGDLFVSGLAVLPFGIVALISGFVGVSNFEVIAVLAVFALSYSILILYTGCTRISGISEGRAAPAVSLIILFTAWLSKVLFVAML